MHSDHVEHTLPIMSFQDMEAVPLQVTYQSAIQSVIISGNENRRIRIGLQGIHFTFTDGAGLADRRVRGCAEATTPSPIRFLLGRLTLYPLIVPSVWARHIENCEGAKRNRCGDEAPPFAGKGRRRAG